MHIGIIGAGIVGLSSAFWLQQKGFTVTLIDRQEPGAGTSFGNAGLFANYARLPFARFSMMCKMPGLLMDSQSALSVNTRYLPELIPYGWRFFKACFPGNYRLGRQALTALQSHAREADLALIRATGSEDLIRSHGCLGVYSTAAGFEKARCNDLREREAQGVDLRVLDQDDIKQMEPALSEFYAGGVFYPDTHFTLSPIELSRRYARSFADAGGRLLREEVSFLSPRSDCIEVQTSLKQHRFDRLVLAAGTASKWLSAQLGYDLPLVSERGYHLSLDSTGRELTRPVGWLDNSVFLTPMQDGIRVAGSAEFTDTDTPPNRNRTDSMLGHARTMLGTGATVKSSWVGSRPSTPDSLPVIGALADQPRVMLATGHGHLGLTLAAVTGLLVAQSMAGESPSVALDAFSPERFRRGH